MIGGVCDGVTVMIISMSVDLGCEFLSCGFLGCEFLTCGFLFPGVRVSSFQCPAVEFPAFSSSFRALTSRTTAFLSRVQG
jgi:hypothetical protein